MWLYLYLGSSIQQFLHPNCLEHLFLWPSRLRRCRSLAHRVAAEVFSVDAAARTCPRKWMLRMDTIDAWETCACVTILCHWNVFNCTVNMDIYKPTLPSLQPMETKRTITITYFRDSKAEGVFDHWNIGWDLSKLSCQVSKLAQFTDSSFQQKLFCWCFQRILAIYKDIIIIYRKTYSDVGQDRIRHCDMWKKNGANWCTNPSKRPTRPTRAAAIFSEISMFAAWPVGKLRKKCSFHPFHPVAQLPYKQIQKWKMMGKQSKWNPNKQCLLIKTVQPSPVPPWFTPLSVKDPCHLQT